MGILRVLLAFAVICAHAGPILGFNFIRDNAVPAFFVISGFYMQLVLSNKYESSDGLKRFYLNRALRILPSYWIAMLVMIFIALIPDFNIDFLSRMHAQSADSLHRAIDGSAASLLTAIPNIFIVGADITRLFCVSHTTGHLIIYHASNADCYDTFNYYMFPPVWTLSNELIFYMMAPFFARQSKASLLVWIVVMDKFNIYIADFQLAIPQAFFWNNVGYFLIGMFACKFYSENRFLRIKLLSILIIIPFFVFAFYPQIVMHFTNNDEFRLLWFFFAFGVAVLFDKTRNARWDRAIGDLSYAIYLIHWQFSWPMWKYGSYAGVLCAIVSTAVAALMVVAVERPVNVIRRRLSVRKAPAPVDAAVVSTAV